MGDTHRREGVDISAFFGLLRRRGLIVVLAVAVGAIAGYVISNSKEDKYVASATLLLRGTNPNQQDDFAPGVPSSPQDREALIEADPVRERAVRQLSRTTGEAEAAAVIESASAASGEDSGSIEISAEAEDPKAAAAAANALAQAAIDDRRTSSLRRVRRALRVAERNRPPPGADQGPAETVSAQRLTDLRQRAATVDGDAEITARATPPTSPDSPKPARDGVIGGFAGLLLGFVLAMTREQLDRRVRGSRELENAFGLPVLASVPRSRALAKADGGSLMKLKPSDAESFQMLRANLRFLNTETELRSVVVTSPGVGDGKSTVSMNLAQADASVGKRVLLIEADLRRPRLGPLLGIGEETGLAAYLADPSLDLIDVTRRVPVSHHDNGTSEPLTMDVVVAGRVPSNPAELVNSERMQSLVTEAEAEYDLVVIDTSPAGLVADAIPLMSQATAVLIVGRVGRITSSEADHLRDQLERIDAPTFGLVANFTGNESAGYGYY